MERDAAIRLYGRWSRGASAKATRWLMLQYEISPPKLAWMTNSILEYAMRQRWLVSPDNRLGRAYGGGVCGRDGVTAADITKLPITAPPCCSKNGGRGGMTAAGRFLTRAAVANNCLWNWDSAV